LAPDPAPRLTEPSAPDDGAGVWFRLFNEIAILEQLSRAMLERVLPDGMIQPHFAVVNHLVRVADGRTPLELARAFQVPKTTMTHTLAGLVARGLVAERPNPGDGRSKRIWLTPAGRTFRDSVIADLRPAMAPLAHGFALPRAAALLPDLEDLRRVLDAARDRKDPDDARDPRR
jgi:DNA-binding MarR family transcriptional regulator